jgi:hypothetical protein
LSVVWARSYDLASPTPFAAEAVGTLLNLVEGEFKGRVLVILAGVSSIML